MSDNGFGHPFRREFVPRCQVCGVKHTPACSAAPPTFPTGRYAVIIADPPWPAKAPQRWLASAGAHNWRPLTDHYQPMTLTEIAALPIRDIAAPDCHLFLWTTSQFLPNAIAMLPTWGFRYQYPFVWHKNGGPQLPGGPCFNAEYIVYARRGKARFHDTAGFFAAFYAPRGAHSAKPAAFYRQVERVTDAPRIDLFARSAHPGFDAWGDQAPAGTGVQSQPEQPALPIP